MTARKLSLQLAGRDNTKPVSITCGNRLCVNPQHLVSGDLERFWSKVQKLSGPEDCWVWTGKQDKHMYGIFTIDDKFIKAHVYAWQIYTKRPVPRGLFVCHHCDHPYCVNPHHLFIGSTQDNTADKVSKNRQAKGNRISKTKLDESRVRDMRSLHEQGLSITSIAKRFTVSFSTAHSAVHRKTWKHVA